MLNNTTPKDIGRTLRELRERNGLTAKDVVEKLRTDYNIEFNHRNIFQYEKNRCSPSTDCFLALCAIYNCTNILHEFGYTEEIKVPKTPIEQENEEIIRRFRSLPESGKNLIRGALGIEKESRVPSTKIS